MGLLKKDGGDMKLPASLKAPNANNAKIGYLIILFLDLSI
jgi:hypothetical protein